MDFLSFILLVPSNLRYRNELDLTSSGSRCKGKLMRLAHRVSDRTFFFLLAVACLCKAARSITRSQA